MVRFITGRRGPCVFAILRRNSFPPAVLPATLPYLGLRLARVASRQAARIAVPARKSSTNCMIGASKARAVGGGAAAGGRAPRRLARRGRKDPSGRT